MKILFWSLLGVFFLCVMAFGFIRLLIWSERSDPKVTFWETNNIGLDEDRLTPKGRKYRRLLFLTWAVGGASFVAFALVGQRVY